MKKTIFVMVAIFLIILASLSMVLIGIQSNNKKLQQINSEYEYYLNREIYGTELTTLINKAIDNNEKREVSKDENGFYIGNQTDSILIQVQMLNIEEPYQMEKIYSLGTEQFITLFNSSYFQSDEITYHQKTGRIATILFKQVKE